MPPKAGQKLRQKEIVLNKEDTITSRFCMHSTVLKAGPHNLKL